MNAIYISASIGILELRQEKDVYQEKMARAVLGGIKRYFAQNPALSKPRLAQTD